MKRGHRDFAKRNSVLYDAPQRQSVTIKLYFNGNICREAKRRFVRRSFDSGCREKIRMFVDFVANNLYSTCFYPVHRLHLFLSNPLFIGVTG